MKNNVYDVVIIGGGVIGCSVARYLSRFELNYCLVERHFDVGEETSSANSAIVHSGYDPLPGTLKAYFNVKGNKMMKEVSDELDVPFKQIGSLTVGFNDEDLNTLKSLKERADKNEVEAEIILDPKLHEIEPNLSKNATCALLCPTAGIISPFELTVAFMENAMDNGAKLFLEKEVVALKKEDDLYKITFKDNDVFYAKAIVNATGVESDNVLSMLETPRYKINSRKGEYFVLDHFNPNFVKHTLFMCPTKVGKGVLVSPTTSYNYLVGPSNDASKKEDTSTDPATLKSIKESAAKLIENIPYFEVIRVFSGVRANPDNDDFVIEESKTNEFLFNVGGIMSPGLASSPAIGEYVSELIAKRLNLKENPNFNPCRRKHPSLAKLGEVKYNELVKKDPRFGRMVCRCEKVSEGEIVDVINRNCGARTIKGVKRRCRPGFGKCQGTFCQEEVIKILARELNVDVSKIKYKDSGSEILKYPSKGEN